MKAITLCLICVSSFFLLEAKNFVEEGQSLGLKKSSQAMEAVSQIKKDELLPDSKRHNSFNSKEAYLNIQSNNLPKSEAVEFLTSNQVRKNERENKNFNENELFLKKSEDIANGNFFQDRLDDKEFSIHTCHESGDPILMTTHRSLQVSIEHIPTIEKITCLGHAEKYMVKIKGSFKNSIRDLEKEFKNNSNVKTFTITLAGVLPEYYVAKVIWSHKRNASDCDNCEREVIKEAITREIKEEWVHEDQQLWELAYNPECTILEKTCLDASSKEIEGVEVIKQCWKERISFFYQFPKNHECEIFRKKYCQQLAQKCIQESPFGCAQWEISFKCFDRLTYKEHIDFEGLVKSGPELWNQEKTPNASFGEVTSKLAVFDAAKKELEKSNIKDATKLQIFSGKKMTCSKSIADDLLYDCCFRYSGLAKKVGLSKCDSDEISLAEMRENGLCHYVGKYEKKILGVKSSDEHVFCCFPSKLARVVQEEGRKQLKASWGEPEEPHCKGISFSTLAKLDFSKMDFSEMCEDISYSLPEDFDDKIRDFQNKLKEQIKNEKELKK